MELKAIFNFKRGLDQLMAWAKLNNLKSFLTIVYLNSPLNLTLKSTTKTAIVL